MKKKQCCRCKSTEIIRTNKDVYCGKCGLVLSSTTKYVGLEKVLLPYGLIFG